MTINGSPTAGAAQVLGFDQTDWAALAEQHGSPLLVLDCDRVRMQFRRLTTALPGVRLCYAIKALPHEAVVTTLMEEGASFDLATPGEVRMVERLGVNPRDTIHTHPIKSEADIRCALRFGCTTFVVDNVDELQKFAALRHRVGLLVRVGFSNPDARVDLSSKFGCAVDELEPLLHQADRLGLHVKGLSFHVGSQVDSPRHHVAAIRRLAPLFSKTRANALAPLSLLDIGGGFPANYDGNGDDIDVFCAPIRAALAELPARVRLLAEPGRFIAAPALACVTRVIGRARRNGRPWYYLDDGVYGSFSGTHYDHTSYPIMALRCGADTEPSVLAGPTCDSIDVISDSIMLPPLELGDLLVASMIGAYSMASASEFNSLPRTAVVVLAPPVSLEPATHLRLA